MDGWWPKLSRGQKLVFVAATLAWLFDCFDQQIFNLSRSPAIKQLVTGGLSDGRWLLFRFGAGYRAEQQVVDDLEKRSWEDY